MTPSTPHKFWSPEEEQRLRYLLESNSSLKETAQLLGRSSDAIIQKAKRLGLQLPLSWQTGRKSSTGAVQALSWFQALLADVKNMADVNRIRRQVDRMLEEENRAAAKRFERFLQNR